MIIEWKSLIKMPAYLPFSQFCKKTQSLIENDIYKVTDTQYLKVTPYADSTLELRSGGPFIAAILWACGDGACIRALRMKIEQDELITTEPPTELVFDIQEKTYAQIMRVLKKNKFKGIVETNSYRFTDGAFVHREINSEVAAYYFRKLEEDDDEMPYAILWKLNHAAGNSRT